MGVTAQDQQSRELLACPFCGREAMMSHSRDGEVCNVRCAGWSVGNCLGAGPNCYTEADAVAGWNRRAPAVQAARALPHGIEPVAWLEKASVGYSFWVNDAAVEVINGQARIHLFTAAQVLAMDRVPDELTDADLSAIYKQANGEDVGKARPLTTANIFRAMRALLAAAPQPPAAQELGEVVIAKNEAGAIVAVTRQDEEGRILSVLAESVAQEREPLDQVAAMKLGMAADDATRKHCRGTTNWAHALTRFYEKALERMPTWEPKFDVMAPGQEDLAVQFCNEISGPLGKPGRAPDPVRLLEMAEELYKAERDAASAAREAS